MGSFAVADLFIFILDALKVCFGYCVYLKLCYLRYRWFQNLSNLSSAEEVSLLFSVVALFCFLELYLVHLGLEPRAVSLLDGGFCH